MPSSSRLLQFVGLASIIAHGRGVQAWSSLRIITSTWTPPRLKLPQGWSKGYSTLFRTTATRLKVHRDYEADLVEQLVGGEKYEMNELPDSMMDTTVFVGNLCEFVQDNDLSQLFRSVSSLQSLPACVVRKPDTSSLRYGFVSFQTAAEKEAAIIRFHGTKFRGRTLKVEEIRDLPRRGRVRVPERMIAYVSGPIKQSGSSSNSIHQNSLRRVSKDDVERLSRGQPSKRKGYGSRAVPHRLNDAERAEIERAARKGFVTFVGGGNRRTRKGSPLANIHRQWCDARGKPQICLYKATGGSRPVDQVVVDLSPLRLNGLFDNSLQVEDYLVRWKTEILTAANANSMQLCRSVDEEHDDEECDLDVAGVSCEIVLKFDETTREAWATKPIWQLPVLALIFQGERSNAKALTKALALLWDIPEATEPGGGANNRKDAGAKKGRENRMKGLSHHRKRGGGHRQSFY